MTRPGRLIGVIDDTPEDRSAVLRHLADGPESYQFALFSTFEEAAAAFRSSPPDCVLLDYSLEGTDGLEVLEGLTGGTGAAPFAIIMLTGRGSEAVAVQAMKRGAVDYLVKGQYTPGQLRQAVAEAIAKFEERPALERRRVERERAHREAQDASPGHERLILIVDDSPEDRLAARRALTKAAEADGASYRILEEATGGEALALCRSAGLDCLILDYSLPDMDGLEFLHELTGGTGITPFPVLMLTGRGDEAIAVRALKRGAADYLVKGRLGGEALRSRVEQAIQRVAARRVQEEQRVRVLERLEAEARRRADQLAEADRRKDEFLAMLAHELRNPLAPVVTSLHILRRSGPLPENARTALEIASIQMKHLARLVDDLMEVSRISRGKITLRREPADLVPIVARVAEAARPLMDAHSQELRVELPGSPIPLFADPTRLDQVFTNLLNNASKYTDDGGRVEVLVGVEEGPDGSPATAVVRVSDTGMGIDGEMLPRVFDLFAQADRSLDRARGGLGIGLTMVRTLTEQHGGTVQAHSDGPGKGTTFTVRLPIDRDDRPPAATGRDSRPATAPMRLLVVDDCADGALAMAMLFRALGHEVQVAHDGVSAVEAVRAYRPDVAFLDIGLPRLNGYEVARAILAEHRDNPPLLAAVTGYGQVDDRRRAEEAGFHHHLVKPVDVDDLLRILDLARDEGRGARDGRG
ncbi:hybrid sensor histidine kinase/response regulator [Aquisphaera insulae]|uniref:hybrid sensor histidine kinase/response regulator n=1 Tax=Aquisphaera insulae TaxID=2712864 RepID=UPI0013EA104D|nr:response regulator [Aquisphaera insulae]